MGFVQHSSEYENTFLSSILIIFESMWLRWVLYTKVPITPWGYYQWWQITSDKKTVIKSDMLCCSCKYIHFKLWRSHSSSQPFTGNISKYKLLKQTQPPCRLTLAFTIVSITVEIRDVMVWKFLITIIVTKIITVISIITLLLKCAGNVQKVLTHKSFHQVLYFKSTNNK